MKGFTLIISFFLVFLNAIYSQAIPIDNSVVLDSSGFIYPSIIWKKMVLNSAYKLIKKETSLDTFFLVKTNELKIAPKNQEAKPPNKSLYNYRGFVIGEKPANLKAKDINGNDLNLKSLFGKVVVFNFWNLNNPLCTQEIPELNKIVQYFKDTSGVVFYAISSNSKNDVLNFLNENTFEYNIIDDGSFLAKGHYITTFPTNVVINRAGKVAFIESGYNGLTTSFQIKEAIKKALLNE